MKVAIYMGVICLFLSIELSAQTLPQVRSVDWTLAGLTEDAIAGLTVVDMSLYPFVADGSVSNDLVLANFMSSFGGQGAVLQFPSGVFLFNSSIQLPSGFVIKGRGADSTVFRMDLAGNGHAFDISGNLGNDTSALKLSAFKDSSFIELWNTASWLPGDWIRLRQDDADLVSSSWAVGTVGQIVRIDSIAGNRVYLNAPLRMEYSLLRNPYAQTIHPVRNVGIECLKIERIDDAAPQQACNIQFRYAVDCWIKGIESENCTFAHVKAEFSSNLYIAKSYFHHGFDYGGGGRAYGVVFQFATGACLAEDNIFEHLRHSMLLQAGANGNVFAYNYSFDPFWSSTPSDAAGDIVLHGNYVYANLFEQNICRNIVIDNSHGPNGPFNTFFRNRAEGYGVFFSASNSPNQNLLGNDITNTSFPYSFANYTIQGTGHFMHGNNNKGTIVPTGTASLVDLSYAYNSQPIFVSSADYAKIGTPNNPGVGDIPAKFRFASNSIFSSSCTSIFATTQQTEATAVLRIFPNPVKSSLFVETKKRIDRIALYNEFGSLLKERTLNNYYGTVSLEGLSKAVYLLKFSFKDGSLQWRKIIKS